MLTRRHILLKSKQSKALTTSSVVTDQDAVEKYHVSAEILVRLIE